MFRITASLAPGGSGGLSRAAVLARLAAACALAALLFGPATSLPAHAATFTVNSLGDRPDANPGDGLCRTAVPAPFPAECTLRAALQEANARPEPDTVAFNIRPPRAGSLTIRPASALPIITSPLILDATTQPGYAGSPIVELSGPRLGPPMHGLEISEFGRGQPEVGGSTVRGLAINRFRTGIVLASANNVIQANFLGTDLTGSAAMGNGEGVRIQGVPNNLIGGTAAGARNVIAGNLGSGVLVFGSGATGNRVEGNSIGTPGLGNARHGVLITSGANGNLVGGTTPGAGNNISFNGQAGVRVESGTGNALRANRILANGGLGIDLGPAGVTFNDLGDADVGPNSMQNFPFPISARSSFGTTVITGRLGSTPDAPFTLEFFASGECDGTGHGEGQRFLGSVQHTTLGDGQVTFTASLPVGVPAGQVATATATSPAGDTSEFSRCVIFSN